MPHKRPRTKALKKKRIRLTKERADKKRGLPVVPSKLKP